LIRRNLPERRIRIVFRKVEKIDIVYSGSENGSANEYLQSLNPIPLPERSDD
jgi:hypothetical protein